MSQSQILKVLDKGDYLFASEIISKIRVGDEHLEYIRRTLKQMRNYGEVKFAEINCTRNSDGSSTVVVSKKLPQILRRIKGRKITRPTFIYWL